MTDHAAARVALTIAPARAATSTSSASSERRSSTPRCQLSDRFEAGPGLVALGPVRVSPWRIRVGCRSPRAPPRVWSRPRIDCPFARTPPALVSTRPSAAAAFEVAAAGLAGGRRPREGVNAEKCRPRISSARHALMRSAPGFHVMNWTRRVEHEYRVIGGPFDEKPKAFLARGAAPPPSGAGRLRRGRTRSRVARVSRCARS